MIDSHGSGCMIVFSLVSTVLVNWSIYHDFMVTGSDSHPPKVEKDLTSAYIMLQENKYYCSIVSLNLTTYIYFKKQCKTS